MVCAVFASVYSVTKLLARRLEQGCCTAECQRLGSEWGEHAIADALMDEIHPVSLGSRGGAFGNCRGLMGRFSTRTDGSSAMRAVAVLGDSRRQEMPHSRLRRCGLAHELRAASLEWSV
jgi:hypothetical protein